MGRTVVVALLAVAAVAWFVQGDIAPSTLPGEDGVTPSPSPEAEPVVDDEPDGVEHEGRWWPSEPTDSVLVFAGTHHLVFVDLDGREMRTHVVAELTGGDPPHRVVARGEALVFWGGGDVHALRPGPLEQVLPPARTLARSTAFVPSADPDRIWVMEEPDAGRQLLELTIDGEVTREVPAPHPHLPQLALAEHLLFADGELSPLSQADAVQPLGDVRVLAGQGSTVAFCDLPSCERLHVRDLAGGEESWTDGQWDGALARFDPAGERLALASPATPGTLHILDHDRVALPESEGVVGLTWSTDGDTLFAVTAEGDLVVHRVDGGGTEVLDLRLRTVSDVVALPARGLAEQWGYLRLDIPDTELELWYRSGELLLYDRAAEEHPWSAMLAEGEHVQEPTAADGVLYLPTSRTSEGDVGPPTVRAIDLETGALLWRAELLPGLDLQWARPAVTADLVLVADTQSHHLSAPTSWVHALDRRTGMVVWRHDLNDAEQGFHASPLVAADGVVAVASTDAVVGIDLGTGRERWRREGRTLPQLVDVGDGVLTVRHDGLLVRLRMADGSEVAG